MGAWKHFWNGPAQLKIGSKTTNHRGEKTFEIADCGDYETLQNYCGWLHLDQVGHD